MKQGRGATRLGSTLVKMGYIPEENLLQFLPRQYRVPAVDLKMYQQIDPAIIKLVPLELVKKHMVLPLRRLRGTPTAATADTTNKRALHDLKVPPHNKSEPLIAAEPPLPPWHKKDFAAGFAS